MADMYFKYLRSLFLPLLLMTSLNIFADFTQLCELDQFTVDKAKHITKLLVESNVNNKKFPSLERFEKLKELSIDIIYKLPDHMKLDFDHQKEKIYMHSSFLRDHFQRNPRVENISYDSENSRLVVIFGTVKEHISTLPSELYAGILENLFLFCSEDTYFFSNTDLSTYFANKAFRNGFRHFLTKHPLKLKASELAQFPVELASCITNLTVEGNLEFTSSGITRKNFLKRYKNVKELKLCSTEISDIKFLQNLPKLETLIFDNGLGPSIQLPELQELQNLSLKKLIINNEKLLNVNFLVEDSNLCNSLEFIRIKFDQKIPFVKISSCKKLKTLHLVSQRLLDANDNDSNFEWLQNLTELEELELDIKLFNKIYSLKNLTQLKKLKIRLVGNEKNLKGISCLNNLRELNLIYDASGLPNEQIMDFDELEKLPYLQKLTLEARCGVPLDVLKKMTNLLELDIRSTKLNDAHITELSTTLKNLRFLTIGRPQAKEFNWIHNFSSLRKITIFGLFRHGNIDNKTFSRNSLDSKFNTEMLVSQTEPRRVT